jgi:hypothetical protein
MERVRGAKSCKRERTRIFQALLFFSPARLLQVSDSCFTRVFLVAKMSSTSEAPSCSDCPAPVIRFQRASIEPIHIVTRRIRLDETRREEDLETLVRAYGSARERFDALVMAQQRQSDECEALKQQLVHLWQRIETFHKDAGSAAPSAPASPMPVVAAIEQQQQQQQQQREPSSEPCVSPPMDFGEQEPPFGWATKLVESWTRGIDEFVRGLQGPPLDHNHQQHSQKSQQQQPHAPPRV